MKIFFVSQILLYFNLLLIVLLLGLVYFFPSETTGALSWFIFPLVFSLLSIFFPVSLITFIIFWKDYKKQDRKQ